MQHGVNCTKEAHVRTGYLHDERDDSPYNVDGLPYCGRCHVALLKAFATDTGVDLANRQRQVEDAFRYRKLFDGNI